jgi:hypothetical protein
MLIQEIIAALHDELALLEQVIVSLEKLSPAEMLGSVHPPAWRGRAHVTRHRSRDGQNGLTSGAGLSQPKARLCCPGAALSANRDERSL